MLPQNKYMPLKALYLPCRNYQYLTERPSGLHTLTKESRCRCVLWKGNAFSLSSSCFGYLLDLLLIKLISRLSVFTG